MCVWVCVCVAVYGVCMVPCVGGGVGWVVWVCVLETLCQVCNLSPDPLLQLGERLSRLGLDPAPPSRGPTSHTDRVHSTETSFLPNVSSSQGPVSLTTSHTHTRTSASRKLSQGNDHTVHYTPSPILRVQSKYSFCVQVQLDRYHL